MSNIRNYIWSVVDQPVECDYPFKLPNPDSTYVHLTWESRNSIGVHVIHTQHLMWGVRASKDLPLFTNDEMKEAFPEVLEVMKKSSVLRCMGFNGYTLVNVAVAHPVLHHEEKSGAVAAISWVNAVDGVALNVETFHDLQRKAKTAQRMSTRYARAASEFVYGDEDGWRIAVVRCAYNGSNREVPEPASTYRNMYALKAKIIPADGPIGYYVENGNGMQYVLPAMGAIAFKTPARNLLFTVPTVENFDSAWLYAMVIGENAIQFYFTDIPDFKDIHPDMRTGVTNLLMNNSNLGFDPKRVEFVRCITDDRAPAVLLESGLVVHI